MIRSERIAALKHFESTPLEKLLDEFWDDFYCGYTDTDRMYDLGYDIADCVEADKINEYNSQYSDLLQQYLCEHGKDPFEDFHRDKQITEVSPFLDLSEEL